MKIPLVDLKAQYNTIKPDIDAAIQRVIEETAFIGGSYVAKFKDEFAALYSVKYCIPVANGTDAIYIIMKILGIGKGDEVITVANSWISTSETISQTGAKPVFIDVDDFFTINVDQIEQAITPRTRAIIPVHLYGQMCDIEKIEEICNRHNLYMIEDCAQSHFSEMYGIRAGLRGIASTFSFFPGKNLGAYGDAGAIITNEDALAEKMKMFANHGALIKHQHKMEGINSRLDGLQAAILSAKLPYILEWTEKRIACAKVYDTLLSEITEIEIPKVRPNSKHSYHLYVIKAQKRDELVEYLKEKGIETAIHYPTPLPFMEAYQYLGYERNDFPVVTENQSKILSLPIFPELTSGQQEYVCDKIKEFYSPFT